MENIKNRKLNRLNDYDYSNDGYYYVTICTKNREDFFGKIENEKMFLNDYGKMANQFWKEIPNHFPNCLIDEYIIMPNHIHGILIIDNTVGNADLRSLPENNNTVRNANLHSQQNNNVGNADLHSQQNNNVRNANLRSQQNNNVGNADLRSQQNNNVRNANLHSEQNNNVRNANLRSQQNNNIDTVRNANLHSQQSSNNRTKMYLSKIIHGFKSSLTREIRKIYNDFNFGWQKSYYDHIIRNEKSLYNIRQYITNNPLKWGIDENNLSISKK